MVGKAGRNDPCPCGSGKKYKQCCWQKDSAPAPKKKFTAKIISGGGMKKEDPGKAAAHVEVNLMDRTFGQIIERAKVEGAPPIAPDPNEYMQKENS